MTTTTPFPAIRNVKGAILKDHRLWVNGKMIIWRVCDRQGNKNTAGGASCTGYCLEGSEVYHASIKKLIEANTK
jgi:hypothetical protein